MIRELLADFLWGILALLLIASIAGAIALMIYFPWVGFTVIAIAFITMIGNGLR